MYRFSNLLVGKFRMSDISVTTSVGVVMHAAIRRPYATGGIALVGPSVIAVSPIAPPLPDIHLPNQHELQAAAVRLTAGWDPLAALQNAFNTASTNPSTPADNLLLAPGVGLQQAILI